MFVLKLCENMADVNCYCSDARSHKMLPTLKTHGTTIKHSTNPKLVKFGRQFLQNNIPRELNQIVGDEIERAVFALQRPQKCKA